MCLLECSEITLNDILKTKQIYETFGFLFFEKEQLKEEEREYIRLMAESKEQSVDMISQKFLIDKDLVKSIYKQFKPKCTSDHHVGEFDTLKC